MTQEFINKILFCGRVDTRKYRYISEGEFDNYHQYTTIQRLPKKYLSTTTALNDWEIVWSNEKSLKTYNDGWYQVRGTEVYVEDGIVTRGIKKDSNGHDVAAYTYISDGHGGFDRTTVSIIEFIGGKGTLL